MVVLLFISLTLLTTFSTLAGPQVVSVSPEPQSMWAPLDIEISISFNGSILPESVDSSSFYVFGRWSGPAAGEFLFEEDNSQIRFVSERPFMAGEWVTVSLSRHIEGADGEPTGRAYAWNFWIAAAPSDFEISLVGELSTRRPDESLIRSYGAYAGDLNRDGYSDLLIPNEDTNDIRVFLNDGAGRYDDFEVYIIPEGNLPSTNEGADFDLDGYADVAVGNSRGTTVSVWLGDGAGNIAHVQNAPADLQVRGLCVLDADGDGDIDIVTANRLADQGSGNVSVLLNDGNGQFAGAPSIETESDAETACAAIDANADGLMDLLVGTHTGNELILLLGDGEGGFSVSDRVKAGRGIWMVTAGDVNGDGFADGVSVDAISSTMSVALGDGMGGLSEAQAYQTGAFPIAIDLGDVDGDGDLDAVASTFSSAEFDVFENTGGGTFVRRLSLPSPEAASCAVLHDRDNDGDLDITGIDELADRILLFESSGLATGSERPTAFVTAPVSTFPNPFADHTNIVYELDLGGNAEFVIFDALGRIVRRFDLPGQPAGEHRIRWDGRDEAGRPVSPGLYLYRLEHDTSVTHGQVVRL